MNRETGYRPSPAEIIPFPQHKILAHVPEDRSSVPQDRIHTAEHELQHVWALNNKVIFVSVVPEGDTLGRTVFAGNVSVAEIQIGASGSFATHTGEESGFGSDLQKATMLTNRSGGVSLQTAEQAARARIFQHPPRVRQKAAEIMAYLQEVPGSMIPLIMARAYDEVAYEDKQELNTYAAVGASEVDDEEVREITVVDYLDDGLRKITHIENNVVKSSKIIYPTEDNVRDFEGYGRKKKAQLGKNGDIFIARVGKSDLAV